jgi:hypothetical protein
MSRRLESFGRASLLVYRGVPARVFWGQDQPRFWIPLSALGQVEVEIRQIEAALRELGIEDGKVPTWAA